VPVMNRLNSIPAVATATVMSPIRGSAPISYAKSNTNNHGNNNQQNTSFGSSGAVAGAISSTSASNIPKISDNPFFASELYFF
jgi:hypothetical protein